MASTPSFLLSLAEDGISAGGLGHLRELLIFPWFLPSIYEVYMLKQTSACFSLVNLSLITGVSAKKGGE